MLVGLITGITAIALTSVIAGLDAGVKRVLWMTAFGSTAIGMLNQGYHAIVDAPLELQLFSMLNNLPLAAITSFRGIVLVIVFSSPRRTPARR